MKRGFLESRRTRFGPAGVVGVLLLVFVGACGSDDSDSSSQAAPKGPPTGTQPSLVAPARSARPVFTGDAADVEHAFLARLAAFREHDVEKIIALSAHGSSPGPSDELRNFMDNFAIRMYRINAIDVRGDTAEVDYEDAIVGLDLDVPVTTLLGQHDVWKREGGAWKWSSNMVSAPGIPKDLATVTVQLRDGATPEIAQLPAREFGFRLENHGAAPKGTFLLGIPRDFDLQELVPMITAVSAQREDGGAQFPDGVLEMGAGVDVTAGGVGTMVFNAPLPSGRYVLVTRGGDHGEVLAGEYADFTVG